MTEASCEDPVSSSGGPRLASADQTGHGLRVRDATGADV